MVQGQSGKETCFPLSENLLLTPSGKIKNMPGSKGVPGIHGWKANEWSTLTIAVSLGLGN